MNSPKLLEHCCYQKYLHAWWENNRSEGVWHLIHFGDHMMWELIQWFVNLCYDGTPATVTIAIPAISQSAMDSLSAIRLANITLLTAKPLASGASPNATPKSQSQQPPQALLSPPHRGGGWERVFIPDLHTQIVTISGAGHFFTLSGGLLQAYSPGKYITTVTLTQSAYDAIQPQLASWLRFYTKRSSAPNS